MHQQASSCASCLSWKTSTATSLELPPFATKVSETKCKTNAHTRTHDELRAYKKQKQKRKETEEKKKKKSGREAASTKSPPAAQKRSKHTKKQKHPCRRKLQWRGIVSQEERRKGASSEGVRESSCVSEEWVVLALSGCMCWVG